MTAHASNENEKNKISNAKKSPSYQLLLIIQPNTAISNDKRAISYVNIGKSCSKTYFSDNHPDFLSVVTAQPAIAKAE